MTNLIKVGDTYNIPSRQYCCDTNDEFEAQLENDTTIPVGTEVIILDSSTIKVKGPSAWVERASGGGGGGGSHPDYPWASSQEGF